MITGDNVWNAMHIAKKTGIVVPVPTSASGCVDQQPAASAQAAGGAQGELLHGGTTRLACDVILGDIVNAPVLTKGSTTTSGAATSESQQNANSGPKLVWTREVSHRKLVSPTSCCSSATEDFDDDARKPLLQHGDHSEATGPQEADEYTSRVLSKSDVLDLVHMEEDEKHGRAESWSKRRTARNFNGRAQKPQSNSCDASPVFALSQAAFTHLAETDPGFLDEIFPKVLIFGSMSPSGKVDVIRNWKKRGVVVGMCGDGGNDCAALKMAHVGVALVPADGRTTEVSIVAPFSASARSSSDKASSHDDVHSKSDAGDPVRASSNKIFADVSIHAVVELLKEGRCALENCVACYKFFLYYGILSAISKMLLKPQLSYYSELHFFFQDAIFLVLVTYALASNQPHKFLSACTPCGNVLQWPILLDISLPVVFQTAALLASYAVLEAQSWFRAADWYRMHTDVASWADQQGTFVSGLTGWWAIFGGLSMAVTYSLGSKHRRTCFRNYALAGLLLFTLPLYLFLLFGTDTGLHCAWRMNCDNANSHVTDLYPFTLLLSSRDQKNSAFWFANALSNQQNSYLLLDAGRRWSSSSAGTGSPASYPFENQGGIAAVGQECQAARQALQQEHGLDVTLRIAAPGLVSQCVLEVQLQPTPTSISSDNEAVAEHHAKVCQDLCVNTWSSGDDAQGRNRPTAESRFFCWWAATAARRARNSSTAGPAAPAPETRVCYLAPQLDAYGFRSVGPAYRLIAEEVSAENEKQVRLPFLASRPPLSASGGSGADDAEEVFQYEDQLSATMKASTEVEKVPLTTLQYRNAHNLFGLEETLDFGYRGRQEKGSRKQRRLDKSFAWVFLAICTAAFGLGALCSWAIRGEVFSTLK
ncbi:unnamed protein product [Amoebophrya sp. A120]|nr:unnamed protein product [Amoebophrya sp. A120]|eukprot:GSA120T00006547001.1